MLSVCNECPYPRDNDQYLDGILQLGRKTLHRPQPESRPDNPEKRKATRCHRRSQNRPEGANLIEIPCDLHISERPEWGSLFLCRTSSAGRAVSPCLSRLVLPPIPFHLTLLIEPSNPVEKMCEHKELMIFLSRMEPGTLLIDPARCGVGIVRQLNAHKIPFIPVTTDEVRAIQAGRLRERHGDEECSRR